MGEKLDQWFMKAHPWVLHGAFATSNVPQMTLLPRGSLPIRATCSAFFTSCSARVLNRLDVYLYILGGWGGVTRGPEHQRCRAATILAP